MDLRQAHIDIMSQITGNSFGQKSPEDSPMEVKRKFRDAIREAFGHTNDEAAKGIFRAAWKVNHAAWDALANAYRDETLRYNGAKVLATRAGSAEIIAKADTMLASDAFLKKSKEERRQELVDLIVNMAAGDEDVRKSVITHYENQYNVSLADYLPAENEDAPEAAADQPEQPEQPDAATDDDDDIPSPIRLSADLLARLFVYARESARSEMELHRMVANIVLLSKDSELTLDDYERVLTGIRGDELQHLKYLAGI